VSAVIRPARPGDLPQVVTLWRELIDLHTPHEPAFTCADDWAAQWHEFAAARLEDPLSRLLVAEAEGAAVGYLLAMISSYPPVFAAGRYGNIYDVLVTERWRGHGLGERLVAEILDWFRAQGLERAELRVLLANEAGRRFWERMGFAPFLESRACSL
jgi:GNAT superfamily N-acetyltransferase